jgi:nitrate/nitrite transport system ATP-binding protein
MAFLELKNVSKGFGPRRARTPVLRGINLEVERGEFVAVIGYSGSGKTTLMSMVAGLQMPDHGRIMLGGREVEGPGPERALVFQNYSLLPWLSVFDNVHLAVDEVFAHWSAAEKRRHTEAYVELVNLTAARHKRPHQLSGGMRQRVSLARALAMDPELLLLDEPFSALDALTRATLQDEVGRIWRERRKTVLLITNDVDEALLLADRVIPLSSGPNATFGPEIPVLLERPRDRKALHRAARFREARASVLEYLLGPGRRRAPAEPCPTPGAVPEGASGVLL